jgi:hypothetical protein
MAEIWKCCPGGAEVDLDELRAKECSVMCLMCGRFFYGPKTGADRYYRLDVMKTRPGDFIVDRIDALRSRREAQS